MAKTIPISPAARAIARATHSGSLLRNVLARLEANKKPAAPTKTQ
jgi:hypothetical protein